MRMVGRYGKLWLRAGMSPQPAISRKNAHYQYKHMAETFVCTGLPPVPSYTSGGAPGFAGRPLAFNTVTVPLRHGWYIAAWFLSSVRV